MTARLRVGLVVALSFAAGFAMHALWAPEVASAQSPRVFEIRTYTSPDAEKLKALHTRFREHTVRIFQRHGMQSHVYLSPQDAPLKDNTLIYVISHASREQAKKNWADFQADPEWQQIAAASNANGRIVTKVDSVFADATDYSPLK